jgi:hypothetical protein
MQSAGVLVEVLNIGDPAVTRQWRAWYDDNYLSTLVEVPGVVAARRGHGLVGSAENIVVYDLADFLVPTHGQWQAAEQELRSLSAPSAAVGQAFAAVDRRLYRQTFSTVDGPYVPPADATVLHGAFFEVSPEHHDEFNDWYNTEHVLFVDIIDGYYNCRRFQAIDDPSKFLALYDVTNLDVANSPTTRAANQSAWSDRVRAKLVSYSQRRIFEVQRFHQHSCVETAAPREVNA